MNKHEFLQELSSVLYTNQDISDTTILANIPEWDSLGIMSTVTMYESFCNKSVSFEDLSSCNTIKDLMILAGVDE